MPATSADLAAVPNKRFCFEIVGGNGSIFHRTLNGSQEKAIRILDLSVIPKHTAGQSLAGDARHPFLYLGTPDDLCSGQFRCIG